MATLTNTQISVTYVGLLKTSGNTILDSTPQQITDGSGNNSQLFLSTTKVGVGATPSGSDTLQITGTSSFSSHITLADNAQLRIGTSTDLQVLHDASDSFIINNTGDLYLRNLADDKDIIFQSDDGSGGVETYFLLDGSANSDGNPRTIFPDNAILALGTSQDFTMQHNATNTELVNVTGNLNIKNSSTDGDISFFSDDGSGGTTEYFRLDGGSSRVLFSKNQWLTDNVKILLGNNDDLEIVHNGSLSQITNATGDLYIQNAAVDKDIIFRSDDGSGGVATYMMLDGSATQIKIEKETVFADNVKADFGAGADLQIYHNGTNSVIDNITGDLFIRQFTDDGDIMFQSDDGSGGTTEYFRLDGSVVRTLVSQNFDLQDNVKLRIGTGDAEGAQDLQLYHNGSSSYIEQVGTGDLNIQQSVNDKDIVFICDDGSGSVTEYFRVDGGDELTLFSKNVKLSDSVELRLGNSDDLVIKHNGTNSVIDNTTGDLIIQNQIADGDIIFKSDDGSDGLAEYFRVDGGNTNVLFSENLVFVNNKELRWQDSGGTERTILELTNADDLYFGGSFSGSLIFVGGGSYTERFRINDSGNVALPDNGKLLFGAGSDLEIFHDGSNSRINETGTGNLIIQSTNFQLLKGDGGEFIMQGISDAEVSLYYNGSKKFETTNTGATVTGALEVNSGTTDTAANFTSSDASVAVNFVASDNSMQIATSSTDGILKNDGAGSLRFFNNGSERARIDSSGNLGIGTTSPSEKLSLPDAAKIGLGDSNDLLIYHDASDSYIHNDTGDLLIENDTTDGDIIFKSDNGSGGLATYFSVDGGGTDINFFKDTHHIDNVKAKFGSDSSGDLQIYHDGTDSSITNDTGDLNIINNAVDQPITFQATSDGSGSNVLSHYLAIMPSFGDGSVFIYKDLVIAQDGNDGMIRLGASQDLEIYHDGTDSFIDDSGTGDLRIRSNFLKIEKYTGETMATFNDDNSVVLYFDNSAKFETTTAGADVTGTLNLDNLTIDGAQGSDGQVLTSTGSGIAWEDASGGGGGASSLNGLSDVTIDGTSAYFINIPSGLSGNPANNLVIGDNAGNALTDGHSNVTIGHDAGDAITTGDYNVCLGVEAGTGHTTNSRSVYIGYQAGKLVNASSSVVIGERALDALSGAYNQHTVIGSQACTSTSSGNHQVAFGYQALNSQTSGNKNTAVGYEALELVTTGDHNTALGYEAGDKVTGEQNTLIGGSAGSSGTNDLTSGDNNTIIGYNAAASSATVDNEITLGNSSIATLRCQVTSITALSDKRDKENIQPSNYGLDVVDKLKPVTFDWNTRDGAKVGQKDLGFIAQDLQEVDDENLKLVYDNNPEKLEASYGRLVPVLVKAIQELKAEIELLKSK
jgi:hypothetical protein